MLAFRRRGRLGCLDEPGEAVGAAAKLFVEGDTPPDRDPALPPPETGVLGVQSVPVDVTVAAGAALFDQRYGLAGYRPDELVEMPYLANDRLDDAWSHGDLLITLASDRPDALLHALRQLMRGTRRWLSLHWVVDGCSRPDAPGSATGRTRTATSSASRTAAPTSPSAMTRDDRIRLGRRR